MELGFPFRVGAQGRSAGADGESHVRELIEQVLFTSPGERVNRPTFGSGLLGLVFAPANEALSAATQQLVQSALAQWLGDLIQVEAVKVEQKDSTMNVTVQYLTRSDQQRRVTQISREV